MFNSQNNCSYPKREHFLRVFLPDDDLLSVRVFGEGLGVEASLLATDQLAVLVDYAQVERSGARKATMSLPNNLKIP